MTDSLALAPADPQGVMQLVLWTDTSLTLPESLTYEAWEEFGRVLDRADRSLRWWIGDWWRFGERKYGEMASQAVRADLKDETGLSYESVRGAAWVADRIENVRRRTDLSWSHHREVAALEPAEQDSWLARAESEGWTRSELRAELRRATAGPPPLLPAGKFDLIYADPPWRYEFVEADNRAIENQYPTLSIEEICDYRDANGRTIQDAIADSAVLFMWATNPKLSEALQVVEAWGFEYRTNLVWVKDKIGMGYWARSRHELLLVARRGDFPAPAESLRPDSVIAAPRLAHSAKPAEVYELLESLYPNASRAEIFARSERPGWASFGNQVAA